MAKFDKSKFIKDRVMANAEIVGRFLKEDSTSLAQGALSKLEVLYEDI